MKRLFSIGMAMTGCFLVQAIAQDTDVTQLKGERVGWARLKTPSETWRRHSTGDPTLMQFLRENTSLNIDPRWYVADVEDLKQLCGYPLLFSQDIHVVEDKKGQENLIEYLKRGGFLLIDSCINQGINPDPDIFLLQQRRFLLEILPEARIEVLPTNHEIYHCYFQIPGGRPPHTYFNNIYDPHWSKHGLYAIRVNSRIVGIISLSGLQCGWDRMVAPPDHDVACMKMLVNIYLYAMLQGG